MDLTTLLMAAMLLSLPAAWRWRRIAYCDTVKFRSLTWRAAVNLQRVYSNISLSTVMTVLSKRCQGQGQRGDCALKTISKWNWQREQWVGRSPIMTQAISDNRLQWLEWGGAAEWYVPKRYVMDDQSRSTIIEGFAEVRWAVQRSLKTQISRVLWTVPLRLGMWDVQLARLLEM
jgi:glycine betaine/proline transport system substrate-binding protein